MINQFHAGFILSGIRKHLSSKEWPINSGDLLKYLTAFMIETDDLKITNDDSLFVVVDNLLSRGLPTLPSVFVEEIFAERLKVTERKETELSKRIGEIEFDLSSDTDGNMLDLIERSFFIVDPRLTRSDHLQYSIDSWEKHSGSSYEETFLYEMLPDIVGDYACQLTEPQRSMESILRFPATKSRYFNRTLGVYRDDFYGQRVDFAVEFPRAQDEKAGIVIEIDGSQHSEDRQKALDDRRDSIVREIGWQQTVRVGTDEIGDIPEHKVNQIKRFFGHYYLTDTRTLSVCLHFTRTSPD